MQTLSTKNHNFNDSHENYNDGNYWPGNSYFCPDRECEDSSSSIADHGYEHSPNWYQQPSDITHFDRKYAISVFDVAAYILKKIGEISTMKLQKLVYYCQAWSLVWDEQPLFNEEIEAWANGPVVRALFYYHRGQFRISSLPIGNPDILNHEQCETIDAVLNFYGSKSAQWLIDLSHMERPWKEARKGLSAQERGNKVIQLDAIAEYYSSL